MEKLHARLQTMTMNKNQRSLCVVLISIIIAMGIYPPFYCMYAAGVVENSGYGWIFHPPSLHGGVVASVDTTMLITQWIGTVIVGVIGCLLLKNNS